MGVKCVSESGYGFILFASLNGVTYLCKDLHYLQFSACATGIAVEARFRKAQPRPHGSTRRVMMTTYIQIQQLVSLFTLFLNNLVSACRN